MWRRIFQWKIGRRRCHASDPPAADERGPPCPGPPPLATAIEELATYGIVSYKNWARLSPEERELVSRMSPLQAQKRVPKSR